MRRCCGRSDEHYLLKMSIKDAAPNVPVIVFLHISIGSFVLG